MNKRKREEEEEEIKKITPFLPVIIKSNNFFDDRILKIYNSIKNNLIPFLNDPQKIYEKSLFQSTNILSTFIDMNNQRFSSLFKDTNNLELFLSNIQSGLTKDIKQEDLLDFSIQQIKIYETTFEYFKTVFDIDITNKFAIIKISKLMDDKIIKMVEYDEMKQIELHNYQVFGSNYSLMRELLKLNVNPSNINPEHILNKRKDLINIKKLVLVKSIPKHMEIPNDIFLISLYRQYCYQLVLSSSMKIALLESSLTNKAIIIKQIEENKSIMYDHLIFILMACLRYLNTSNYRSNYQPKITPYLSSLLFSTLKNDFIINNLEYDLQFSVTLNYQNIHEKWIPLYYNRFNMTVIIKLKEWMLSTFSDKNEYNRFLSINDTFRLQLVIKGNFINNEIIQMEKNVYNVLPAIYNKKLEELDRKLKEEEERLKETGETISDTLLDLISEIEIVKQEYNKKLDKEKEFIEIMKEKSRKMIEETSTTTTYYPLKSYSGVDFFRLGNTTIILVYDLFDGILDRKFLQFPIAQYYLEKNKLEKNDLSLKIIDFNK